MTDITPGQVVDMLVTLFRANLTDPLKERSNRGGTWIYDDQPRMDASFPRIWVFYLPGSFRPGGMSNNPPTFLMTARFQVQVIAKVGSLIDVDSDGAGEKCDEQVNYLANQCVLAVKNNQATFDNGTILHAIPVEWHKPRVAGQFMYQDVDFEIEWEK